MAKLKVECLEKKIKLNKLAKYVYEYLGQTDKLKAELIFVDESEIQNLNRQQRNIDKVTDVLSFPSLDNIRGKVIKKSDFPFETDKGRVFIGSIAICVKRAEDQAKEFGHSVEREITYLTLHGLLHLMGYDHIDDADKKQMREIEKAIIKKMKLEVSE